MHITKKRCIYRSSETKNRLCLTVHITEDQLVRKVEI